MAKQNNVNIEPLGNRVLISEIEEKESMKTESGIFIPESGKKNTSLKKGKVVAVGKGEYDNGVLVPMTVKKGDIVLFGWGEEIEIEGKDYTLVKESDISAIIS